MQPHLICKGSSVCCMGFGNDCATFKCTNNVYYTPGGMDAASVYVNGTSGEIIARCGGNILPLHQELCLQLQGTCDMTKPADSVPQVVNNPKNPPNQNTSPIDPMIKCKDPNIDSVYLCQGNIIRTVSRLPGGGSTFYKSDGAKVDCPLGNPIDQSQECSYLINSCSDANLCDYKVS